MNNNNHNIRTTVTEVPSFRSKTSPSTPPPWVYPVDTSREQPLNNYNRDEEILTNAEGGRALVDLKVGTSDIAIGNKIQDMLPELANVFHQARQKNLHSGANAAVIHNAPHQEFPSLKKTQDALDRVATYQHSKELQKMRAKDGVVHINPTNKGNAEPEVDNYWEGSKRKHARWEDLSVLAKEDEAAHTKDPFDLIPNKGLEDKMEIVGEDMVNGALNKVLGREHHGSLKKTVPPGEFAFDHEMHDEVKAEIRKHYPEKPFAMRHDEDMRGILGRAPSGPEPKEVKRVGGGEGRQHDHDAVGEEDGADVTSTWGPRSYYDLGEDEKSRLRAKGVPGDMLNEIKAPIEKNEADKWAKEVKNAMKFVWDSYKERAFGNDEILPVTGQPGNWVGIGVMVAECLDTLWLLNLKNEYRDGLEWFQHLNLQDELKDEFVSSFELNIRVIGGLLGAYSLSGDRILVDRAKELADTMIDAGLFEKRSKFAMPLINLKSKETRKHDHHKYFVLAEAGSFQLEWRYLSFLLKDPQYQQRVDLMQNKLLVMPQPVMKGLFPTLIDPAGTLVVEDFSFGGGADSFYEYLLKNHLWLHNIRRVSCMDAEAADNAGIECDVDDGKKPDPTPPVLEQSMSTGGFF